jgi:SWI/SNF-related matrix-associated actin-dependent regulator 1 of chromatin subfamily A
MKIDSGELSNSTKLLGELMRLRHITALTKIEPEIERIQEFLESTEDEKIAIGIHHTDVRDSIFSRLQALGYNPLKLSGEDSAQRKDWIKNEFNDNPARRVLVVNEIAGGYGLNLQNCSNCDIVERQWNACDEEQFESRFHRNGQKNTVFSTYIMVAGTIDEWFDQMVEEKRAIFGETVGDSWTFTGDASSMKDLAEKSIANPLRGF